MIRTITTAAILLSATAAWAQDTGFTGKCTDYRDKGQTACEATQWCRWAARKPITLPNGKQFTPAGYCAFKPKLKDGWKAANAAGQS